MGRFLADPLDHRAVVEIAQTVGNDAGHGARKINKLTDFREPMWHERRDRNAADLLQCEVQNHKLADIRELYYDAVERFEARVEQIQRQVVGQTVEFTVRNRAVAVEQRHAVSVIVKNDPIFLREGLVEPIAPFAVAPGKFRWKWDNAFQH